MLFTISYSESAYPITPVEPLKATLYDHFVILVYLVYFIFICINNNKFTYDKQKTLKIGCSIFNMFNQVILKLFTFLINTTNNEIYNICK